MALQRSNTRATNAELRADLDSVTASVTDVESSSNITFQLGAVDAAVTTGSKLKFRVYGDSDVFAVRCALAVAQSSGTAVTVDVRVDGDSILGNKLIFDNGEKTTLTAGSQVTIALPSLADDTEVEVYVTSVGDGTAEGLSIFLALRQYTNYSPTYDADSLAFFSAAGITNITQKIAVNTLVLGLKSYSIWSKLDAIYPIVGGSSSSHAVNLKSPGTYDITWHGGLTHASTGVSGNGSTGYGDTGLNPSTQLPLNNTHISVYSRSNSAVAQMDIGAFDGTNMLGMYCKYTDDRGLGYLNEPNASAAAQIASGANSSSSAFYLLSRTSTGSGGSSMYRNGTAGATTGADNTAYYNPNCNMFILARNNSGSAALYSARELAFATLGDGLNSTEQANLYTLVQAYQTTLGRQV